MWTKMSRPSILGFSSQSEGISDETRLVEALQHHQLITVEGVKRVRAAALARGLAFSRAATRLGVVSERGMAGLFGELLGIDVLARSDYPRPLAIPAALNPVFLRRHGVCPIGESEGRARLAMANPMDEVAVEGVRFALGKPVERLAALESDIEEQLQADAREDSLHSDAHAGQGEAAGSGDDIDRLSDHDSDAPAIRLAHRLLTQAMDMHASDIHLEPSADALVVRYRIDGILQEAETLSGRWSQALISRLKLMARLDIAEKRLPQDGRIRFTTRGVSLDLRVATFPTLHGESMVLRLLGQHSVSPELERLELDPFSLSALRTALERPHGIVLITGPTGSGKTTTLYAALNAIRSPELKIVTVEDPIEYTLPGVAQLQVKPEIGLTYGAALRSVLRNDPDVIMIGEIRDSETADIAIRSALTGHLVLATLHTNTAAGTVTRLLDLGVADYLLASTLVFAGAQRLVRRLCPACVTTRLPTPEEHAAMAVVAGDDAGSYRLSMATGCPTCRGRGYSGRIPLFEALAIGTEERGAIRQAHAEEVLQRLAREKDIPALLSIGLRRVLAGETTLDEVLGVIEDGRL
ncbi:GspE/PulE family protein [Thauera sp. Sel9]|uniref:GspE/PulE family protein n=1 Tax=Thauera sp. Sel9 TaxID=2974299 RepID=UPI0021E15073|nr:GspE/PulE family protein [Thauera sp. Sel9]MCV2216670.1 GspE/PulE family protein [Thauera sp. Sel9]